METIINNPGENKSEKGENNNNSSGGSGVVVGAVIVVLVLIIVIILALPYIRSRIDAMSHPGTPIINPTINVQLPTQPSTGTTTK